MMNAANGRRVTTPASSVVRKIAVTLVTGGAAYLITLAPLDAPWALTLSVFIGGVVLVVQFLAEFDGRLETVEEQQATRLRSVEETQAARLQSVEETQAARLQAVEEKQAAHTSEVRDLVRQSFLKINRATELFGLVEASALRTDAVIQLVQHSTGLGPDVPPLVSRIAQAEIVRTSRFLKELGDGTASYEGEDRDWLLALTHNVKSSIDATSLSTVDARGRGIDSDFWQSDLGQRYLEMQRSVARNGIKIRRIFVVERPGVSNRPEFYDMCRMQARMNIEVRILTAADLEPPLKTKLLDFILFDNVISYEMMPAYRIDESSPPEIVHTRLQLQREVVEERMDRYHDLWERAKPFLAD
jgi:hypothetical protein